VSCREPAARCEPANGKNELALEPTAYRTLRYFGAGLRQAESVISALRGRVGTAEARHVPTRVVPREIKPLVPSDALATGGFSDETGTFGSRKDA